MRSASIRPMTLVVCVVLGLGSLHQPEARADRVRAARELSELVIRKFSGKGLHESAQHLAPRIARAGSRYGDDLVESAVMRVGPRALKLADEAADGKLVCRILSKYGDQAVVICRSPRYLAMVAKHGDDAARILARSQGTAAPLIQRFGRQGVRSLGKLDAQSLHKLTLLDASGQLAKLPQQQGLLRTIGTYGDRAVRFVWNHKLQLAGSAAMALFLADPEKYLSGAADLAKDLAKQAGAPIIASVKDSLVQGLTPTIHHGSKIALVVGCALVLILLAPALLNLLINRWCALCTAVTGRLPRKRHR